MPMHHFLFCTVYYCLGLASAAATIGATATPTPTPAAKHPPPPKMYPNHPVPPDALSATSALAFLGVPELPALQANSNVSE
jgi:hypothetical protein